MDIGIGYSYGINNHLKVVDFAGRDNGRRQLYSVECSVCCLDKELYGDAKYVLTKSHIGRGSIPCGCGRPAWSEEQYVVRINRKCTEENYKFLDFVGKWENDRSKIRLECLLDGCVWDTMTINNFLHRGNGCPTCLSKLRSDRIIKSDYEVVEQFMKTGAFKIGTTFKRLPKISGDGRYKWEYICPVCSYDEFVENKLCSGKFVSKDDSLRQGKLCCRCSERIRWTKEQREYQVNKLLVAEGSKLEFVGWEGPNVQDRIRLSCNIHGSWPVIVQSFLYAGSRCPACAKPGFSQNKTGYVYVLNIEGVYTSFTGYGITNNLEKRLQKHKSSLSEYGLTIADSKIFETSGELALNIETKIKRKFPCFRQEVVGFIREATYSKHYSEVINFVQESICEKF